MDLLMIIPGWVPFVFIIVGLVFIIIEMNIPGFGVPGVIGVVMLAVGICLYAKTPLQALILLVVILTVLGSVLAIVLKSASKGRLSRKLVLNDSLEDNSRFPDRNGKDYYVGSEGTTLTALRPSGAAEFDGIKLDVVSDGEFIEKNTAVIITKIEGNRIVVKKK